MSGKHSNDYSEDYRIRNNRYQGEQTSKINKKSKTNKKRKTNKTDAIFMLLGIIYALITILFYISVVRMNLLPSMYVTIFTITEIIFTLAITVGLAKKHKTLKLNIFCLIIAILISSVYIYVTNYANATTDFLGSVFTEAEETEDYYVVVRKDSKYNNIQDIDNKDVFLFQVEDDVKTEIGNKVSVTLRVKDSLSEIGKNLLDKKVDVILVSSVQYTMLSEELDNFKENTKIIYTATHKIEKEITTVNKNTEHTVENGIFNVYVSGIDTSGNINNVSRSDANIVATINTKTHEVLLTSIPRDYYVTLHTSGSKDKLTHSGIYGVNETVTTVEDLLDIDINYYVRVNFTTLIKLVDTLGGIDVYSDYTFSRSGYNFYKGNNHINGDAALVFSRERYSFSAGDNQRVKNQQAVIEAIMKKVLNSTTILTKYTSLLNSLEGSFQTNMKQNEISNLVKGQLENMSSWTIKSNSLTGTGASKSTYSYGSELLYVMIPDATSVQQAKDKISDVMGE